MTVRQIQHLLAYLGYYTAEVDGIWGRLSAEATSRFQQRFGGLTVDGIAGEQTQQALRQAVAEGMPGSQPEGDFWSQIRHWSREEFRCRCGGKYCSGFPQEPDRVLVELVDALREKAGRPARASSGLRCTVWNRIQGGVSNSRHLSGKALDFSVEGMTGSQLLDIAKKDPRTRYAYIIDGAWVHVDVQ